jgi:hypothetical protein
MTHLLYHIKATFYITYFHENYKPERLVTVLSAESLLSSRHISLPDDRATARDRTANGCEVPGTLNGIRLLDVLVEQARLINRLFPTHKTNRQFWSFVRSRSLLIPIPE